MTRSCVRILEKVVFMSRGGIEEIFGHTDLLFSCLFIERVLGLDLAEDSAHIKKYLVNVMYIPPENIRISLSRRNLTKKRLNITYFQLEMYWLMSNSPESGLIKGW